MALVKSIHNYVFLGLFRTFFNQIKKNKKLYISFAFFVSG